MKNAVIFILLVICAVLFLHPKPRQVVTKVKIDTVTVIKTFTKVKKGSSIPFKVLDTILNETIRYDTITILQDYNLVKSYSDTIRDKGNTYTIQDTISQNKIIGRGFKAEIQEKTITVTKEVNKASLYLGFRGDLSHDYSKVNYNVTLSLKTRQKGLFQVGYGMSGYSLGYAIKF